MLDIVGARFRCLVCESFDICAKCESAAPFSLHSSDGGHVSSHIMIKVIDLTYHRFSARLIAITLYSFHFPWSPMKSRMLVAELSICGMSGTQPPFSEAPGNERHPCCRHQTSKRSLCVALVTDNHRQQHALIRSPAIVVTWFVFNHFIYSTHCETINQC